MRIVALIVLLLSSVLLSACTDHSTDYLRKGGEVPTLVVPSDVPTVKQQPYLPVPPMPKNATVKPVSLLPPTMLSGDQGSAIGGR